MTDWQRKRDEAWAKRANLKYDPLPLDEIAKAEFVAGADWARAEMQAEIKKHEAELLGAQHSALAAIAHLRSAIKVSVRLLDREPKPTYSESIRMFEQLEQALSATAGYEEQKENKNG